MKTVIDKNSILKSVELKISNGKFPIEKLEVLPHRQWNDLTVYYLLHKGSTVDYNLMMSNNCTEEELFAAAIVNTRRLHPEVVTTLRDRIESVMGVGSLPDDYLTGRTFVITNEAQCMGQPLFSILM